MLTRRQLLACRRSLPGLSSAAMSPNDKFDLLVCDANVLDRSQSLLGGLDLGT